MSLTNKNQLFICIYPLSKEKKNIENEQKQLPQSISSKLICVLLNKLICAKAQCKERIVDIQNKGIPRQSVDSLRLQGTLHKNATQKKKTRTGQRVNQ